MASKKLRVGVQGASGRMGRRILALAFQDPSLEVAAALCGPASPHLGADAGLLAGVGPRRILLGDRWEAPCDALIDFSSPGASLARLRECVRLGVPTVIGTTGFGDAERAALAKAARKIAVLWSPNMSLGANLLRRLARQAAEALDEADIEIVEAHHNRKQDAPSGTALWLAEAVEEGRRPRKMKRVYGRRGKPGPRSPGELGILAVRAGDIVGDHTLYFGIGGERLELVHRAHSRDAFASGAIQAAKFLAGKPAGLYSMDDVLCQRLTRSGSGRPDSPSARSK